jgi:hypothetical protein
MIGGLGSGALPYYGNGGYTAFNYIRIRLGLYLRWRSGVCWPGVDAAGVAAETGSAASVETAAAPAAAVAATSPSVVGDVVGLALSVVVSGLCHRLLREMPFHHSLPLGSGLPTEKKIL